MNAVNRINLIVVRPVQRDEAANLELVYEIPEELIVLARDLLTNGREIEDSPTTLAVSPPSS